MCGFAGIIGKYSNNSKINLSLIVARMAKSLNHRGPDEEGEFFSDNFAVAHKRLSIIDMKNGQQPMLSDDERVGIAFNGEIYNHHELRKDLESQGFRFKSHCDTEVVLNLFIRYGEAAFALLDGMFALAIWDFRNSIPEFYLARDHFGTKPLYVYEDVNQICFSSELRTLLLADNLDLSLDYEGLNSYFTFRYIQAPKTLYKKISRVECGTYIKIKSGLMFRNRYWTLPNDVAMQQIRRESDAEDLLRYLLQNSVKKQLMGEVPVGILLSGGLDSSIIAHNCAKNHRNIRTFNIGFADVNEFEYADLVSNRIGFDHINFLTTEDEILSRFSDIVESMDEPIADPACFPLYILGEEIRKHSTVLLSGEGADEFFGGYPQYYNTYAADVNNSRDQFGTFLKRSHYFHDKNISAHRSKATTAMYANSSYFFERGLLNGMLAYDTKTWLPENLMMKADKILMSHSIEGRFPFISRDIVEFAFSLPDNMKIGQLGGKHILKRAFQNILPKEIINRNKMGFSVPLNALVHGLESRLANLIQLSIKSELSEFIDFGICEKNIISHFNGDAKDPLWVWTLTILLEWFSHHDRLKT